MNKMKNGVVSFLLWSGCVNVIRAFWISIETAIQQGQAVNEATDTIICVLFSTALWWIVRGWDQEA